MDSQIILYSFSYKRIELERNSLSIKIEEDPSVFFYINTLTLQRNIRHNNTNKSLELLSSGDYLTHDGLLININNATLKIKVTFLETGSYLETQGDGSAILSVPFGSTKVLHYSDNDTKLSPSVIKGKRTVTSYFNDKYRFNHINFIKLNSESPTQVSRFLMERIVIWMDTTIGEFIGENNQFNLVTNLNGEYISPLVPDYDRNGLDNIF